MPIFICPNCGNRTTSSERTAGFREQARACAKCGFGFLFELLDDYYPAHMDSRTGLVHKPDGYGDYAFLRRTGPVTYYNVLYVHALRRAADLATLAAPQPNTKTSCVDDPCTVIES